MNRNAAWSWGRRHPLLCDAALGLLAVSVTSSASLYGPHATTHQVGTAGALASVLCVALVTVRRIWPIPALLAVSVITLVTLSFSLPAGFTGGAILLAAWTVAVRTRSAVSLTLCGSISAALLVRVLVAEGFGGLRAENLNLIILTLLAAAAGIAVRDRRAYLAALVDRADRAERTRETEAARRVAEERLRIARDLHDSLAHHMAVVNVQTGVAAHLLRADPDVAEAALGHARTAAGQVLDELGTVLGVLRSQGEDESTEPAPSLARIATLVDAVRASGMDVRSTVVGRPRRLPPAVDQAAFRLVQEALTNAQKHAPGSQVQLTIEFGPSEVILLVLNGASPDNAAPAAGEDGSGFGLAGMRERCAAVAGRLQTGFLADGGFRVFAALPASALADPESSDPESSGPGPTDAGPTDAGPARATPSTAPPVAVTRAGRR
ncbi:sensor histidine kinase [Nakamurella panacisegetis]|uniref:sensor histidine kinase n=1 Tax=Nakamurella panacisegetis TaxID=1090615 RepID=UPI0012FE7B2C|nr:histidine kinase [Nakamurella panacisegetis]